MSRLRFSFQDLYVARIKATNAAIVTTPPTTMPTIFVVVEMGELMPIPPGLGVAVAEGFDVAVAKGVDVGVAPGRTKRLSVRLNSSLRYPCRAHRCSYLEWQR